MPIFVSKNGQTFGPHEPGELAAFLRNGTFLPGDFCWKEGWSEWRPLSTVVPGTTPVTTPPPAARPAASPPPPPTGNRIPEDVEITGTLKFSAQQTFAGKMDGPIDSDHPLTLAKEARVKGKITAESLVVFGSVEGNLHVKGLVALKSTADLRGDVHAARIVMEDGAVFNGSSHVGAKPAGATNPPPSSSAAKSPAKPA